MSENSEVMVIDEIINNMEIDDVLEEIEDIENPVVELEVDSEFEVIDKRQSLQESYNEYNESYVELSELLRTILATGEYTEENKQQILETNDVYDDKYRTVVKEMDKAKSTIESNKALDFNGSILMNTQDDVFNALTKNGEVQAIYRDSEGKIYINAQYLQTRGLTVVNDNNQVTLKIDNKGNLTTSGDIVGGTITGSVMKAMTINTNEVNITSNDGGMSISGALQKFSDENGNVRILIGKDTDGSFKFMLYGENGSTVLIDKNGIKSEAISAGTIKTDHLAPNSISTKHLKTEVMEAVDAKVENMTADKATIGQLNATNAQINQLNANKANVSDLTATNAKVENLTVNKANVSDLNATNATVSNLKAETAKINQAVINKADIGQLNATNANIGTLQANVAKIDNVLAGNITSENIQAGSITSKDLATGTITAGSGIIADGAIGSAQISSVDAGKVSTGKLDTGKVTVAGANNHLKIQGNRLQVFQGTGNSAKERVSLGDVNGDGTIYGLRVRGADGKTVLLDENGVKSEGITDGSITNNKISDNAQIDGAKLNIDSVINKINDDGTETINGTKIEVDGQNLNAKLSTITNKQTLDGEKITQAQSQISANTNAIKLKVDNQTYQTDKKTMTNTMNKNTSAIDVLQGQIDLKVERTDIEDAVTDAKNEIDKDIKNLNKRIDDVLADVGGAIIEGALDEAKCDIVKNTLTQLNKEKEQLLARFNSLYTNDLDSATKSSLLNSKNNFVTAHTNLVNVINRIIEDKNITQDEKTEYDGKVSAYSTALSVFTKYLDESIKSITNTKINTAKAEIKLTTDAITQTVSSLSKTVENKADNSQVSTVSNRVASLETNLNGITQRVESTESTTSSLTTKVNTAQSTADSKAKVFTSTPTTPYKIGDLWVQGSTGDVMKCKTARSSGNYVASDWEKASKYTDDTKANAVDGKVTTLQGTVNSTSSKVATLETNLSSITQRVQDTETTTGTLTSKVDKAQSSANSAQSTANSALNTANANKSNITSLTTRVSTAESKLTKDGLTTTIGKHYTTSSDVDGIVSSKGYQSQSQVQQTVNSLQAKFTSSGGYNLLRNGCAKNGTAYWSNNGGGISVGTTGSGNGLGEGATYFSSSFPSGITGEWITLKPNTDYIYSAKLWSESAFKGTTTTPLHYWCSSTKTSGSTQLTVIDYKSDCKANEWNDVYVHFKTKSGTVYFKPFIYLGGTTNINFSVSEIMLCEGMIKSPYSPHPSEVYDGVTTIDKDGVTVTASNVKSKTNMSADGFKIVKTDTGEEVFKVNSDGTLSIKGSITVTGGSVPTNSLSGTISSNQLNSSITSDINNAKNNASTALSTANTAKTTADSAKSTATNAQNTANTAKSTADSANTTASAVKKTVDANSTNWSNAYNRVKEWANGAVTGSTSINGGMIATNTITANKIAVGDFNNYSQLQKGRNLTNSYGNAIWSEANAEWTTSNAYFPFTLDNTDNAFNVGDKINIKCSVWVNQSASLPIGVWFYDSNKVNTGTNTSTKAINAGWNHLNFELTLSHDSIKKSPYMQILIKTEGNSIAVKDVVVTRKVSGEMLIDGAVTASKLHADAINGKKITGVDIVGSTFSSTSGNFKVLNDGTVDATSLSVNDEISTETLTVQKINNSKYQTVLDKDLIININPAASNSQVFENDATYKSVSAFLDACPQNLNGHTVLLNFQSNLTENIEISKLHSGELTLQLNQKIIYGYVYLVGDSMRYRIYGDNPSTINGSKYGSIMPNIGMSQAGGCYSLVMHSSHGFFYDLKVYGGKSTDSNIGIRIGNWSSAYLSNINFIGCYNGLRAYNLSKAYIASSAGTTTSYAFSSYHGSQVVLNPTTQAGKAGATSHVFISNNSTVTSAGVTWSSSAISGSNTNSSTTKVEKTVTINSTLGDSYRSTVYNNWKKDSTVRQGNYGYGNCEGCWFYGDQFVPYQSKEITKVEITIKRQAGGVAGAVTHTLKMHNYTTRPSGRPTFSTALSKNFSVATNNSITVALTTAAEINAFKANKGFGLVPTAQNSTYYSVCSGSAQVKITYKE